MKFWDSSAIVPLVVQEEATPFLREQMRSDRQVLAWWAARVEVISALARAYRAGLLDEGQLGIAAADARTLLASASIVIPSTVIADRAERLLMVHDLRAADALQLAAALVAVGESPRGTEFVCLDKRLRSAATREGFHVLPEG